ncbi:unnamed protein product [Orchesella dallaii]|uniref:Cytochrome c oxidase assembly protein COX20, mitochondrial n=1 Tax=Orchesella dallaii TaxID=48710 RepID=A0ABP1S3T9_9HEXA
MCMWIALNQSSQAKHKNRQHKKKQASESLVVTDRGGQVFDEEKSFRNQRGVLKFADKGPGPISSMRKIAKPSRLLDRFHKGFVWGCLGLTTYGFYIGGIRFYQYMTVTRPSRLAAKEKLIQAEDPEELKS